MSKKNNKEYMKEDIDIQNIRSVLRMTEYLKRLFYSYNSICETLSEFLEQQYYVYNELNFQSANSEVIETYNKSIIFMNESIKGILTDSLSGTDYVDTQIIKPVEKDYYTHNINLTYFINDSSTLSRFLGMVSNVSITEINNQIILERSNEQYVFSKFKFCENILIDDFRYHLDAYIHQTKKLIGFFYKDVEYVKNAVRTLLMIISETVSSGISKKHIKNWECVIEEIKDCINLIKTCTVISNTM